MNALSFQTFGGIASSVARREPFAKRLSTLPPIAGASGPHQTEGWLRWFKPIANGNSRILMVFYRGRDAAEVLDDIIDGIAKANDIDPKTALFRRYRDAVIAEAFITETVAA